MKKLIMGLTLLTMLSFSNIYAQTDKVTGYKILKPTKELIDLLIKRKVDITGGRPGEFVEIYDYSDLADELKKMGYDVQPLITAAKMFEGYTDYDEMVDKLLLLESTYPEIMQVDSIGYSVEGRTIWAVKVSDNVNETEDELRCLVVGSYHGDEVLNTEVVLYQIEWLVENYSSDSEASRFVDAFELHFMPLVNPDGRASEPPERRNKNNVDLNRNHNVAFIESAVHGPNPFSEPETQAVRRLAESVHFDGSLSYHSSGDVVLRSWGYTTDLLTPDEELYINTGILLAESMNYTYMHPFSYLTFGEYGDYMYGRFGALTYTIETYYMKIPLPEVAVQEVNEANLTSFLVFLDRIAGTGITGLVTNSETGIPIDALIEVIGYEDPEHMNPRKADAMFGRYNRMLEPGTYTVTVSHPQYSDTSFTVDVYEDEPVKDVNIALKPASVPVITEVRLYDGIEGFGEGNGNAIINSDETLEIKLSIENTGLLSSGNITATLTSEDTMISVVNGTISVGTLDPGEQILTENKFLCRMSDEVVPGYEFNWKFEVFDDNALVQETVFSAKIQGFLDNFEPEPVDGWISGIVTGAPEDDNWEWGEVYGLVTDPPRAYSGQNVFGNDLGSGSEGLYGNYVNIYLQIPSLDFTGWDQVYLQFYRWLTLEEGDSAYISVDGTVVWASEENSPVQDINWTKQTIDISSPAASESDIKIRFGLVSDQSGVSGGWTLDDVMVNDTRFLDSYDPGEKNINLPERLILKPNYPNPFNLSTYITVEFPEQGAGSLKIYSVLGRLVRTVAEKDFEPGLYKFIWDGKDDSGRPCSSGIYFYRAASNGAVSTKKMILIK